MQRLQTRQRNKSRSRQSFDGKPFLDTAMPTQFPQSSLIANISQTHLSGEYWSIIGSDLETQGYDKEAYEHELSFWGGKSKCTHQSLTNLNDAAGRYIVKLEGPLTPSLIQEISKALEAPEVVQGSGEDGEAQFCIVEGATKRLILYHFSSINSSFRPTFARFVEPAEKNFSDTSRYPTLGIDSTLPQYRPNYGERFLPAQDQYPVWYFFYGTLGNSDVPTRHLGLNSKPGFELIPTAIKGGKIRTWAGKYKALMDGEENIDGWAYLVMEKGHKDALRSYETGNYEVVRCVTDIGGVKVPGCTFRFMGVPDN